MLDLFPAFAAVINGENGLFKKFLYYTRQIII